MLRLGLLQCDSLDQPHGDVDGDYDVLFTGLVSRPDVEMVIHRPDLGDLPRSPADCDAWLVPGSRHSVYDEIEWIVELRRFVARLLAAERPTIGVCFGHQMIAQEMGAPVGRAEIGWNIGAIDYELHRPPPREGETAPPSFTLIASHQDQVFELPHGAELLASAPTCPVAGYTDGDRILAVQAHPEFGPDLARSLYRSRVGRLGADRVETALSTLGRPLDRGRVSDWIVEVARR